jgi:predicted nucleotidyltransferase
MTETKTLNIERIINILKEHKEELKERYGIKGIGVFGSYVRGEYKKKSDLDVIPAKAGIHPFPLPPLEPIPSV